MITDFLWKDQAKEWFNIDWTDGVAATGSSMPHVIFLGDYQVWKMYCGFWGFEDINRFCASVVTHETIHQLLYQILNCESGSKTSKQFDKIARKLLFTPLDFSLLA